MLVTTKEIEGYTYYLDELKKSKREASNLAGYYRRQYGWKVRVLPYRGEYGVWVTP